MAVRQPPDPLKQAEAAREAAWAVLDAAHRAIPDCEHVAAWRERIELAKKAHQAAIRVVDLLMKTKEEHDEGRASEAG